MSEALFREERQALQDLLARGYRPRTVYDIGGSNGIWSEVVSTVLPDAAFHLFEPLAEAVEFYKTDLDNRLRRLTNLHLHSIALGNYNGVAEMFITHDGWGSSVHDRGDIPELKQKIQVPIARLEDYVGQSHLPTPDVIKIDTQGAEAMILEGAGSILRSADVLFLETWLIRGYGQKCPLLNEIVDQLRPSGFTLADLGQRFYDGKHRLYSVDAVFFSERLLDQFCNNGSPRQA